KRPEAPYALFSPDGEGGEFFRISWAFLDFWVWRDQKKCRNPKMTHLETSTRLQQLEIGVGNYACGDFYVDSLQFPIAPHQFEKAKRVAKRMNLADPPGINIGDCHKLDLVASATARYELFGLVIASMVTL